MAETNKYEKRYNNTGAEWNKIKEDKEITSITEFSFIININNGSIMVKI